MVNQTSSVLKKAVIIFLCGFLGSLIIGLIFLGIRIIITTDPAFQFISYGISGSVIFALLNYSSKRNFILGTLFFLALEMVLIKIHSELIFARIAYFLVIVFSIYLYHTFFYKSTPQLKYIRIFALAGIVAIINVLLSAIGGLVMEAENLKAIIEGQSFFGLLIGLGLGVGIETGDLINNIRKE